MMKIIDTDDYDRLNKYDCKVSLCYPKFGYKNVIIWIHLIKSSKNPSWSIFRRD